MSPQRGLITEQRRVPTMAHRLPQRRRPFPSNTATVEASQRISAAAATHPRHPLNVVTLRAGPTC